MIDQATLAEAEALLQACRAARLTIATAESCTGGLIAATLTAIAGSSDVVERGFVTYSNDAKTEMLGVPAELIAREGAVSEEVARAMAEGALAHSPADLAVSVTGVAGPGGGTAGEAGRAGVVRLRPPWRRRDRSPPLPGDRAEVRRASVAQALRPVAPRTLTG